MAHNMPAGISLRIKHLEKDHKEKRDNLSPRRQNVPIRIRGKAQRKLMENNASRAFSLPARPITEIRRVSW